MMRKKYLFGIVIVFCFLLLLSCSPLTEIPAVLVYEEIKDGETVIAYTVAGVKNEDATEAVIPETYQELPVVSIKTRAFDKMKGLKHVSIAAGITEIESLAFRACSSLESVTFAEGSLVASIGNDAFVNCDSLVQIAIPAKTELIGAYAFLSCDSLERVVFSADSRLRGVGEGAFMNCVSLQMAELPNSLARIPSQCFEGCSEMILFSADAATDIGSAALRDCGNLRAISIEGAKSIGESTFRGCASLKSIHLPNGLDSIGVDAFRDCTSLQSVTIPKKLTSMGEGAFGGCISLAEMTLPFAGERPNGLEGRFLHAFGAAGSIPRSLHTVTLTGSYRIAPKAFLGCDMIMKLTIPSGTISIGKDAFEGCNRLVTVINASDHELSGLPVLPSQEIIRPQVNGIVTTADDLVLLYGKDGRIYLMEYLGENTELDLRGLGITDIYPRAFANNSELRSVILPNSVTVIGEEAFKQCWQLSSITIPASVRQIGNDAFAYCSRLQQVKIEHIEAWCQISFENPGANPLFNKDAALYLGGQIVRELTISDEMTRISEFAFYGYGLLERITIGKDVNEIGRLAFYSCDAVTQVLFADSEGWSTGETPLNALDLLHKETAAQWLTKEYATTSWIKE